MEQISGCSHDSCSHHSSDDDPIDSSHHSSEEAEAPVECESDHQADEINYSPDPE